MSALPVIIMIENDF